jgi:hypothetical protein
MGNADPRKEVPMTAESVEDVWSRTVVGVPFRVELRPAELAGPRRRV